MRHRFQSPGAHHPPLGLGHPQLHPVAQRQPAQQALGPLVGDRVPERLVGHRAHRAHVGLVRHGAQGDALGELDRDREEAGVAHHDRLGLLRLEARRHERLVQPRGVVVPAGLPLDAGDLGVRAEVGDRRCDEVADAVRVRPAQVAVGDEAASPGERHQPQRPVHHDREGAGRLGIRAQLLVVGGQEGCGVGHPGHGVVSGRPQATALSRRCPHLGRYDRWGPAISRRRASTSWPTRSCGSGVSVGNWIDPFDVV